MFKPLGFVPVVDDFVEDMPSLYPAYVLCYMWTYSNSDSKFDQPIKGMPERLKIAKSTITKWVKWLCDQGYLIDLTPDEVSKPHVYELTDKSRIDIDVEVMLMGSKFRHRGDRIVTPLVTEVRSPLGHDTAPMIINHDINHDEIQSQLNDCWRFFRLDQRSIPKMLAAWNGDGKRLLWLVEHWIAAAEAGLLDDEEWTKGKIYNCIRAGEMPPEKPRTFGDEVRELMELQNGGEVE